jgi:hypothetical protein
MVVRMLVKPIYSVRCVSSKEVSNSTVDSSMRDGVNADDRKVLICFQLVFTKHPTTVFPHNCSLLEVLVDAAEGLPSFATSLVSTSCAWAMCLVQEQRYP